MKLPRPQHALLVALALLPAGCSSPEQQKQRHFEQGNTYVAQKRDDFAVIEYANAVRIDPKFGEARLKLAETYERMNNIQAAFPEYIRAADALPENRDAQVKAIELLLLAGRFDDARARATSVLEKNPKDADVLLLRANATAGLKDLTGAIAEIEQALRLQPNDSRAFVSLGEVRSQAGDHAEAEAAFKQAISLQPSAVAPRLAFANFLWSTRRPAEAEQEIKQAITAEPKHLLANRMLAALYMATNRANEAEAPLKAVVDVSGAPEARFELARYYVNANREDDAIKMLNQLAGDPATSARAAVMLASIEYDNGRTREGHARLDKLLASAPNNAAALTLKAQWLTKEKKLDEALDRAKAAVLADPQSAEAHFTLGAVHSQRREVPDAIKAYNEVLRINPRVTAAQLELSRLNLAAGDRDAALRYAQEAKQRAPADADVRVAVVRSLLTQRELDSAGIEIAELLRNRPDLAVAHALNGTLQALRNQEAAAKASYTKALQIDPQSVDAISGIIALDLQDKQFGTAVSRIEAALATRPDNLQLLLVAARVYDRAGQQDKAEQTLRRAVAADPRSQASYEMLAQLYMKQRKLDAARAEFEGMVKRAPRAVGPRTMVGIILEAQGKRAEAKRWYEATIADLGVAPLAANNLAYIYAEEGSNLDTALRLASSAKKDLPDSPQVDDTLGWVYYKKDLVRQAIGPLEESAKKMPDNPEVQYHLGMAYAKLPDKARARAALERALKLNPQFSAAASARQTLASLSQ